MFSFKIFQLILTNGKTKLCITETKQISPQLAKINQFSGDFCFKIIAFLSFIRLQKIEYYIRLPLCIFFSQSIIKNTSIEERIFQKIC